MPSSASRCIQGFQSPAIAEEVRARGRRRDDHAARCQERSPQLRPSGKGWRQPNTRGAISDSASQAEKQLGASSAGGRRGGIVGRTQPVKLQRQRGHSIRQRRASGAASRPGGSTELEGDDEPPTTIANDQEETISCWMRASMAGIISARRTEYQIEKGPRHFDGGLLD
jgi:hypothetical protein